MSMDAHEIQEFARLQRIEREYIALRAVSERVQQSAAMYGSDINSPWRNQVEGYNYRTEPAKDPKKNSSPSKKSKLLLLCRSN